MPGDNSKPLPQWQKSRPVEERPERPMDDLSVDGLGGRGEVGVGGGEAEALVEHDRQPVGLEALRLHALLVRLRVLAVHELRPSPVPGSLAELLKIRVDI